MDEQLGKIVFWESFGLFLYIPESEENTAVLKELVFFVIFWNIPDFNLNVDLRRCFQGTFLGPY